MNQHGRSSTTIKNSGDHGRPWSSFRLGNVEISTLSKECTVNINSSQVNISLFTRSHFDMRGNRKYKTSVQVGIKQQRKRLHFIYTYCNGFQTCFFDQNKEDYQKCLMKNKMIHMYPFLFLCHRTGPYYVLSHVAF